MFASGDHVVDHLVERRPGPGHLEADVEPLGHAKLCQHHVELGRGRIVDLAGAHLRSDVEPVSVRVADDDVTCTDVTGDRGRHHADGPGTGDEHVLSYEVVGEGGVGGISQRIQDAPDGIRDVVGERENVGRRNRHEVCKRSGAIHTDPNRVGAQVTPPGAAVATMATSDVTLSGNPHPRFDAAHLGAEGGYDAHELVTDSHRDRDRAGGPVVPLIDVQVGSAYGDMPDSYQDVVGAGLGGGDILHPQTPLGPRFHQRSHQMITPSSSPTLVNAAMACSMSSRLCAADICVRIRA